MSIETIEHTFEVESPARLKVSNIRGHVDIQPGEEGVIHVTVEKHKGSMNNDKTQIIIGQESDGLVVAEAKHENSITNWFGLNKPCKVNFTIRVPRNCSVKMNCVSSSAAIDGLEGSIDANCVSGKLELSNLVGEFDFSSVSGKITAENLEGPLEMNNVSGKVQISDSRISRMLGKTVSGSASIETPLTDGPYEFKSVSGNMSVITPDDTACTIHIKSVSGRAKVNLPVTSRSGAHNKQVIEVAGGGPEVRMKSVSGGLKVGSPNFSESEPESGSIQSSDSSQDHLSAQRDEHLSSESDAPDKSQMEILQEIERGEITVDEALKQMNL
jgi:DUF4097 and DUF4098 domain-containing protein YvlB